MPSSIQPLSDIGEMQNLVEVQKRISPPTRNEFGEETQEWETVAKRWMALNPRGRVPGAELFYGGQQSAQRISVMAMRCWVDENGDLMSSKQRIKWGSRIFNIEVVFNPGERKGTTLMYAFCVEEVPPVSTV